MEEYLSERIRLHIKMKYNNKKEDKPKFFNQKTNTLFHRIPFQSSIIIIIRINKTTQIFK